MKTMCKFLVPGLLILFLAGCGSSPALEKKEIVIQINDSKISLEEFNELLKLEVYADPEMELTTECRDKFIDYLVRKELMIQNAALLKLDRKPEFVRTIEKYWESTLIRNLLDLKSEELKKKVLITDKAIEQYYAQNIDEFELPLTEEKENIKKILECEKLQEKMKEWSQGLKVAADIKIDKQLISQ
jgi:hypothetical protein